MDKIQNLKRKESSVHSDMNHFRQMYLNSPKEHPMHETYKFQFEQLKSEHKVIMKEIQKLEKVQNLLSG